MITGFPSLTAQIDRIFLIILGICVVLLVLVTATMLFFVYRYRRERHPVAEDIEGNLFLEILWVVVPTILVMAMFYYGYRGFILLRTPPKNSMLVKVLARKWSWTFRYENGKSSDVLVVPLGKPVKLSITSEDVLHSLYIPAFRVKEDAVPGMETFLWFNPDRVGEYDLFCAEYCGMGHSAMITKVKVVPEEEFARWLGGEREEEGEREKGLALLKEKGCLGCHSIDGSKKIGPTLKGMFGSERIVVRGGEETTVTADEGYIRRALLSPSSEIVKGFPPIMPSQEGRLTDEEIEEILEFLKTLK